MNHLKSPTKNALFLFSISLLLIVLSGGCLVAPVFEKIDDLREEADETLYTYPKTNYAKICIDYSHTTLSDPNQYEILKAALAKNDVQVVRALDPAPGREGDTKLLATLRDDIGVLILPESNLAFSEKELRALKLFVIFGGHLIITPPSIENVTDVPKGKGQHRRQRQKAGTTDAGPCRSTPC